MSMNLNNTIRNSTHKSRKEIVDEIIARMEDKESDINSTPPTSPPTPSPIVEEEKLYHLMRDEKVGECIYNLTERLDILEN